MARELAAEIASADQVDILVSFIKCPGLRLLIPAFEELLEPRWSGAPASTPRRTICGAPPASRSPTSDPRTCLEKTFFDLTPHPFQERILEALAAGSRSVFLNQPVVFFMGADPHPSEIFTFLGLLMSREKHLSARERVSGDRSE